MPSMQKLTTEFTIKDHWKELKLSQIMRLKRHPWVWGLKKWLTQCLEGMNWNLKYCTVKHDILNREHSIWIPYRHPSKQIEFSWWSLQMKLGRLCGQMLHANWTSQQNVESSEFPVSTDQSLRRGIPADVYQRGWVAQQWCHCVICAATKQEHTQHW